MPWIPTKIETSVRALHRAIYEASQAGRRVIVEVGCGDARLAMQRSAEDSTTFYVAIDNSLDPARLWTVAPPNLLLFHGPAIPVLRRLARVHPERRPIHEIHVVAPSIPEDHLPAALAHCPEEIHERVLDTTILFEELPLYSHLARESFVLTTERLEWARSYHRRMVDIFPRVEAKILAATHPISHGEQRRVLLRIIGEPPAVPELDYWPLTPLPKASGEAALLGGVAGVFTETSVTPVYLQDVRSMSNFFSGIPAIFELRGITA